MGRPSAGSACVPHSDPLESPTGTEGSEVDSGCTENCDGCGFWLSMEDLTSAWPHWPGLACATCLRRRLLFLPSVMTLAPGLTQSQPNGQPVLTLPAREPAGVVSIWVWCKGKLLLLDRQEDTLIVFVNRCLWEPDWWETGGYGFFVMSVATYFDEASRTCPCCALTRLAWRNGASTATRVPIPCWAYPPWHRPLGHEDCGDSLPTFQTLPMVERP